MIISIILQFIVILSASFVGGTIGAFIILKAAGAPCAELWKFLRKPISVLWRDV